MTKPLLISPIAIFLSFTSSAGYQSYQALNVAKVNTNPPQCKYQVIRDATVDYGYAVKICQVNNIEPLTLREHQLHLQ